MVPVTLALAMFMAVVVAMRAAIMIPVMPPNLMLIPLAVAVFAPIIA